MKQPRVISFLGDNIENEAPAQAARVCFVFWNKQ